MELRKLSEIGMLYWHRVEDVSKYTDAELTGMLNEIFGITDIPGKIKALKAKEIYLLASGSAKKPVASLPILPPPVKPVATGGGSGGLQGADPDAGFLILSQKEIDEIDRKAEIARNNPPPDFPEGQKEEPTGKLRGETVSLPGMEEKEIDFEKRPAADREELRDDFNSTERKKFLKDLANDPER
jgi:hypothetical protein